MIVEKELFMTKLNETRKSLFIYPMTMIQVINNILFYMPLMDTISF